jgi:hypothetical protein
MAPLQGVAIRSSAISQSHPNANGGAEVLGAPLTASIPPS